MTDIVGERSGIEHPLGSSDPCKDVTSLAGALLSGGQVSTSRSAKPICLWCARVYAVRSRRGSARRFCSPHCRAAFHTAARQWAIRAILESRLSVAQLRHQHQKAYTPQAGGVEPPPLTSVQPLTRSCPTAEEGPA